MLLLLLLMMTLIRLGRNVDSTGWLFELLLIFLKSKHKIHRKCKAKARCGNTATVSGCSNNCGGNNNQNNNNKRNSNKNKAEKRQNWNRA